MHHGFDVEIAMTVGVDAAIILNCLHFWSVKNAANNKNVRDGLVWTYNSRKAFAEIFPYWSSDKIGRTLRKMEDLGHIVSNNYNSSGYDRTKWYAISAQCIVQFPQLHCADLHNGVCRTAQPIPVLNTVNDQVDNGNADAQPGPRPQKCGEEDWESYLAFSQEFLSKQSERWGAMCKPTKSKAVNGAKALDNIIRVQGVPAKTVYETIEWARNDDFWSLNLLSLAALTKKSKNGETKFTNILAQRAKEMNRA